MAVVAITDVYGPTLRYARAFREAGHDVVRVQSTPEVPRVYRPGLAPAVVAEVFLADLSCEDPARELAPYAPIAVLAGGECGVELADRLAEQLGLPGNGTRTSAARRNKFAQVEAARRAGLRAARQILVDDEEKLRAWHAEIGGRAVVKPVRSAGNDGVHFCDRPEDSVRAYRAIRDAVNIFSVRNEGVVAQEFLHGTEYVVNTVSYRGRHRVTDVWRYTKLSANGVSDRVSAAVSVPPSAPAWSALTSYAAGILDAMEIRYGPVHLEIMLTPDGPCLVELGARLSGADTAYYAALANGSSQIDWAVLAAIDPDTFLDRHDEPLRPQRHVAMCFLTSPVAGTLRSYPRLAEVQALDSHHNVVTIVGPGGRLQVTVDDTTEPLMIGLAHPIESVLERDLLTVHHLDGCGFYELADTR
ncbi:ATP-grasp domain-containing protein [Geodermatophilus sp. DSM 44513]|uniref:ATP-grasp domain-containing protein n=1 Tax=Geodermatophilus sp. DSM 44513 TaxID=1528104 RepID=UPI0012816CCB|nr:ATP-grasp domain-containing protein [Geodermatophilus sp. DSM 44513]WNV77624.1 ATP-grasp domain-containing protein [Geodermatophilus sp. DSM 44513]